MNFWTLEQYKEIIQNVENETARMLIELLFYSGMRCGECFALLRKDFDFNQNTINIDKSYHQKGNIVNPPKTENGYRVITMPQNVMDDLKTYFDKFYDLQDNDRVFPHTRTLIRNHIRKATNKTGIPYIRIHDLRHSHVSLLIDMGFSPHLIAERIGDTVALVQSVYGHLYPNKHKEVADRLNELA